MTGHDCSEDVPQTTVVSKTYFASTQYQQWAANVVLQSSLNVKDKISFYEKQLREMSDARTIYGATKSKKTRKNSFTDAKAVKKLKVPQDWSASSAGVQISEKSKLDFINAMIKENSTLTTFWTEEMDAKLSYVVDVLGFDWESVAKSCGFGLTYLEHKRRYYYLVANKLKLDRSTP